VRVFLDANVLFSASHAGSGIQRLVEWLAARDEVVTSDYAASEAARNIAAKRPEWQADYARIVARVAVRPGLDKVLPVALAATDRPNLATAIRLRCDYLVTGDRRDFGHLFGQSIEGVTVVSPQALSEILLR